MAFASGAIAVGHALCTRILCQVSSSSLGEVM